LLQKVLRQLRILINEAELNSAAEKSVQKNEKMFKNNEKDQQDTESSKISFSQILPISTDRDSDFKPRSYKQETIPWWERIGSNRH
jgi:hypothetical protein